VSSRRLSARALAGAPLEAGRELRRRSVLKAPRGRPAAAIARSIASGAPSTSMSTSMRG
jgi:hypothetical protein